MDRLVVEIRDAHRRLLGHQVVDRFPARIGRAYDNDVIIADPYVHPYELNIQSASPGWQVQVLNPDQQVVSETHHQSGDEVVVGKTHLRLFSADHPVEAARPMHDTSVLEVIRSVSVGLLLMLVLVVALSFYHFQGMTEKVMPGKLVAGSLPVLAGVLIWAAGWSLLAYVVRRHLYFHYFLFITVVYMLLDILIESVISVVAFNINNDWVSEALSYFTGGILLVFLFYASMHQTFTLSRKRKWFLANLFSWGLVAVIIFAIYANQPEFRRNPEYPADLEPPALRVVKARSFESFMADADTLFDELEKVGENYE